MYIESRGIILRTVKYSESSLVLDMYTESKGRKSYIISGIRSKNAKTKAGLLQVMGLVEFVAYDKDSIALNRIKEIRADHLYQHLPFDALRSSIGLFLMEVCAKCVKETENNPKLFVFVRDQLILLDAPFIESMALFPIRFLTELGQYLGFGIQNDYSEVTCHFDLRQGIFSHLDYGYQYSLNAESSKYLSQIMNQIVVSIPKPVRNQILDQLLIYYRYHVENFGRLKSIDILRSIFG